MDGRRDCAVAQSRSARRFRAPSVARCLASPAQCDRLLLQEGSRGEKPACGFDVITDNGRQAMKVHVEGLAGTAYAGVGSRSTPAKVLQWMESIGREMAEAGMVLRSGAAHGADSAFERGCDCVGGDKRTDLPKAGLRGRRPDGTRVLVGGGAWARALGRRHHPAWDRLDGYVKLLMARNTHQVLGDEGAQTPGIVVMGWTPGVRGGGGTGQAYRLARAYRVPVVDLARGGWLDPYTPARLRRIAEPPVRSPRCPQSRYSSRPSPGRPGVCPRLGRGRRAGPPASARTRDPARYVPPAGRASTAPAHALDTFRPCKARASAAPAPCPAGTFPPASLPPKAGGGPSCQRT